MEKYRRFSPNQDHGPKRIDRPLRLIPFGASRTEYWQSYCNDTAKNRPYGRGTLFERVKKKAVEKKSVTVAVARRT